MLKTTHALTPNGTTWAILDANVIIPPRLADIFFDMYLEGFYFPRWTKKIESEFLRNFPAVAFGKTRAERNLIRKNPPTPSHLVAATKRLNAFRNAVGPECEVFLYDQKTFTDQVPLNIPTVHSMKLQFK